MVNGFGCVAIVILTCIRDCVYILSEECFWCIRISANIQVRPVFTFGNNNVAVDFVLFILVFYFIYIQFTFLFCNSCFFALFSKNPL